MDILPFLLVLLCSCPTNGEKPNILLLMADDLGIGEVECYGNNTIRTPNINRLAKEGVKLTHHIAAASLCTPSRSAFLTGRYPIRTGMTGHDGYKILLWNAVSGGLPSNETTFAKILKQQGYSTGIIGKWHLGVNCESRNDFCHHPLNHGFDYFFGIPFSLINDCDTSKPSEMAVASQKTLKFYAQIFAITVITLLVIKRFNLIAIPWKMFIFAFFGILFFLYWYVAFAFLPHWNCILMRNFDVVEQPMDLELKVSQVVEEAKAFITRNKNGPFLLFVSFLHIHTPYYTTKRFRGRTKHDLYGDNIEEMDWMIGEILEAVVKESIVNKTFTYFASDNGAHLEGMIGSPQLQGHNGIYRGGKAMGGLEGGIRVPGILHWPGMLPPNTSIDQPTSLMDIFTTVVKLGGGTLPQDRIIDGKDMMPLVLGTVPNSEHEFMFHYCDDYLHAVRWQDTSKLIMFLRVQQWILLLILQSYKHISVMAMHSKPNFVLMLADDFGIGDLGCYGNDTIRTPNIDRLAKEGAKLTQHIAAAPICTPSRAAFMTGRYAFRSGMDTCGRSRALKWIGISGGLPTNETTFAKILQKEGYHTGILGKWHLGLNCESLNDHCHHPLSHGFNYFYGLPFSLINECEPGGQLEIDAPFRAQLVFITQIIGYAVLTMMVAKYTNLLAISGKVLFCCALFGILFFISWYIPYGLIQYWSCILMKNHEIIEQPMNVHRSSVNMIKEAQQFIERNKDGSFLLIVGFLHVHTPLITTKAFRGKSKHGIYGDNVEEMDFMVGSVVDAIDNAGLKNNTLIYFASDHGGHLEVKDGDIHTGGWNGIYRGGKAMAGWEGGIRVPGIFRWPGVIPSDTEIDKPTSLMDIFPTVVRLGGGEIPNDRIIDGRDLFPLLLKKTKNTAHEFLFHYCGNHLHAVRWYEEANNTTWKAHFVTPAFYPEGAVGCYDILLCGCEGKGVIHHNPPLLFDLSADPSESKPLLSHSNPHYKEVIKKIEAAVAEHNKTISVVPQQLSYYNNLWKPWLQPCCGTFPFCWCNKEDDHEADTL